MGNKSTIKVNTWVFVGISALCLFLLLYVAGMGYFNFNAIIHRLESIFSPAYVLQKDPVLLFIPFFIMDVVIFLVGFSLLNSLSKAKMSVKFWISSGASTLAMAYFYILGRVYSMDPSWPMSQQIGIVQRAIIYGVLFSVISLVIIFSFYKIFTKKKEKQLQIVSENVVSSL